MSQLKYMPHLDGIRGIAVLAVVFFHLDLVLFKGGFVGVDVFFVLSGYLITRIMSAELAETGAFSYRNFYIRRFRRLFPALFVTVFLTSAISVLVFSPLHLEKYGMSIVSSILSFSNFYFWSIVDYFDTTSKMKPLLHTWSLSIEEQFYILWPAFFVFFSKNKRNKTLILLIVTLSIMSMMANFIFADGNFLSKLFANNDLVEQFKNGKSTIFFITPFRFYEFFAGIVLALYQVRIKNKAAIESVSLFGAIIVVFSIILFDESYNWPYYNAILPCVGTVMLILCGGDSRLVSILRSRIFVWIGKISYSLYLVHWPAIAITKYLKGATLSDIDKGIIFISSFVVAQGLYVWVESPFRRGGFSFGVNRVFAVGSVMLVLLIFSGFSMAHSGGWVWRMSEDESRNQLVALAGLTSPSEFHKKNFGGAGYPKFGLVSRADGGSGPDFFLLGDSFAHHYAEGIVKEILEPYSYSMFLAANDLSCLHLPGFSRGAQGSEWSYCPEVTARAISAINQSPASTKVLVSHAWSTQISQAKIVDKYKNIVKEKPDIDDVIDGILKLKNLVNGRDVVIIGQSNSAGGFNLYDIATRPASVLNPGFDFQKYMVSNQDSEISIINAKLMEFASNYDGIWFVDPNSVLCRDGECMNVVNNNIVHSDGSHLTKFSSRLVIASNLDVFMD